jgi:hypothetical protein
MKNKRKGPDKVVQAVNAISIISWLIIFAVIVAFFMAKPKMEGFRKGMQVVTGGWDQSALEILQYLLIFQVLICGIGLSFNAMRIRRKSDKLSRSLIFFAIVSLLGIIGVSFAM